MYQDASPYLRSLRADAPVCAQCRQPMILRRIEREAFQPRTDVFLCLGCGLIDKVEWGDERRLRRFRLSMRPRLPRRHHQPTPPFDWKPHFDSCEWWIQSIGSKQETRSQSFSE
jgi:hypothetical protein